MVGNIRMMLGDNGIFLTKGEGRKCGRMTNSILYYFFLVKGIMAQL
jgi:hypothetical protein